MILAILAGHERPNTLPSDEVLTACEHGSDANLAGSAGLSAIGCVSHDKFISDGSHAGIFNAAGIARILRNQYWLAQPIPGKAILTDGVANAANPIQALSSVEHVKKPLRENHGRVENIVGFPIRGGIRQQNRVDGRS